MNTILPLIRQTRQLLVNNVVKTSCSHPTISRNLHITSSYFKEIRVGNKIEKVPVVSVNKYDLFEDDLSVVLDTKQTKLFPEEDTPNWIFNGVPYKQLPVVDIKASNNNTIISLSDYTGKILALHSAGREGFKNAKKGTNVAAQQMAFVFSEMIRKKVDPYVRVRVQGIGPGRMASLKGLQLGKIEIISITDTTRVSICPPRPRKPKRL